MSRIASPGVVNYTRHFSLLAGVAVLLAVSSRWWPPLDLTSLFAVYGGLHATTLAVSVRSPRSAARTALFILVAAASSALLVMGCRYASRWFSELPGRTGPLLLLACASAIGAVAYATMVQRFLERGAAHQRRAKIASGSIALGCVLATLVIVAAGLHWRAGALWVAVSWWAVFSFGLRYQDARSTACMIHDKVGDTMTLMRNEGGCTCGYVRYRMHGPPLFVHCCHCRWCQRETGSAFALNAMIEADRIELVAGLIEVVETPTSSGKGQRISRCPTCRVAVWSNYAGAGPSVHFVRVGTLDDPDAVPPDIHIFTASKQPWVVLAPHMTAVLGYYKASEHWPVASLERREKQRTRTANALR